jgi:hypothetical protein
MSDKRVIKSSRRKTNYSKDRMESKSSLIEKVNQKNEQLSSSEKAKSSLKDKVNNDNNETKHNVVVAPAKKKASKNTNNTTKKDKQPKKKGKFRNSFFFRLSIIGRVMFVIYAIFFVILAGLLIQTFSQKGKPIIAERQQPVKVVSNEQVNKVKEALQKDLGAVDSIDVNYTAFRFVVVVDMKNDATLDQAKTLNDKALKIINGIIPTNEYFYSKDKLNNDLYIYSSDVVPSNYETNSKFIYQTFQNSKMSKPTSYNLLEPRDVKSAQEVIDTMEKAK